MPSITILPDSVINKIAAGEVIERPASVVKELVENALDAGGRHIDIEIEEGGKKLIRVKDDGEGMLPNQLSLAVARHATSKIRSDQDLTGVKTLGFRGEALASIAAVSQMTLSSRSREGSESGAEIRLEGGKIVSQNETGHPYGTSVLVKYLFYQTPARLKFLKSSETEMNHIVDDVIRQALGHPEAVIRLTHNGKKILSTDSNRDLKRKVGDLFGADIMENCFSIVDPRNAVSGLVSHPQIARSHQRNIFFIVNGRSVKDRVLHHAVMEAYRNLLMHGQYPFVVLRLTLPADMIDVNVHPAKTEVRFSDSSLVHRMVTDAVRQTLESAPWKSGDRGGPMGPVLGSPPGSARFTALWRGAPSASATHESSASKEILQTSTPYSQLHVIGQIMATYIVCEGEGKLVLIDQHAAHERIWFEKLLEQYKKGQVFSQQLLIPENIDLKPSEGEILKKYRDELKNFGIEADFFGGCTFIIRSVPALIQGKISIRNLVLDLVGDIIEKGTLASLKDGLYEVLARMSCHAAIRANHRLALEEMSALVMELSHYPFTSFCPHGRPVAIDVRQEELERWFKRVV